MINYKYKIVEHKHSPNVIERAGDDGKFKYYLSIAGPKETVDAELILIFEALSKIPKDAYEQFIIKLENGMKHCKFNNKGKEIFAKIIHAHPFSGTIVVEFLWNHTKFDTECQRKDFHNYLSIVQATIDFSQITKQIKM